MEADFAHLGIDLRDFWRPHGGVSRLTIRRTQVLIENLPPDAATWAALSSRQKQTKSRSLAERLKAQQERAKGADHV